MSPRKKLALVLEARARVRAKLAEVGPGARSAWGRSTYGKVESMLIEADYLLSTGWVSLITDLQWLAIDELVKAIRAGKI